MIRRIDISAIHAVLNEHFIEFNHLGPVFGAFPSRKIYLDLVTLGGRHLDISSGRPDNMLVVSLTEGPYPASSANEIYIFHLLTVLDDLVMC